MRAHTQAGTQVIKRNPTLRQGGLFLFAICIILGVILALLRAIPDLEATMYGFASYGYPTLTSLHCPVLMTVSDTEAVTIRLNNTLDRSQAWYIVSDFSSPVLILSSNQRVDLQPHERRVISWPIDKQNIAPGNFILANIYTSASGPDAMHEATCGTYVLDLPIQDGPVIFYVSLGLCVVGVGLGLWLAGRHSEMSDPRVVSGVTWMRVITIIVAIGLVAGLINSWFLALLAMLITALATAVFLIPNRV